MSNKFLEFDRCDSNVSKLSERASFSPISELSRRVYFVLSILHMESTTLNAFY